MGSILLINTIIIALITGSIILNFWYSYILFLVIIGGILILFLYITNVASNEKFKFSKKIIILIIPIIIFFFNFNIFFKKNLNFNIKSSLMQYFSYPNNLLLVIIIIYLLITLIAVVKIINIKRGPLRQKY